MATNEQPMTNEALAEIDAYWNLIYHGYYMPDIPEPPDTLHDAICHILELRAEVDRLRAREQALVAENAAMRPVVALVARGCVDEATTGFPEFIVALDGDDSASEIANAESLIEQARAFVAAHPATDTDTATAGEAESEGE